MQVIEEHVRGIEARVRDMEAREGEREERKETREGREREGERVRRDREEEEERMRRQMGLRPVYEARMVQVRVQEYTHALAVMSAEAEMYQNFSSKNEDVQRFDQ